MQPEHITDRAAEVRKGETLDAKALSAYLRIQLPDLPQEPLLIEQFPSGYSNLTYLLRIGTLEYVLRRPPFGANIRSAHDMGREFKVLSLLKEVYEKVPNPVLYCQEESVIGVPFYLMERVKGIILRQRPPKGMELTPALMQAISERTVDHLAELHQLDLEKTGLIGLGKPEGYTKRQVEGWIGRYQNAQTDPLSSMEFVAEWMTANMPTVQSSAFLHNDYKYDNLVLSPADPTQIIAVLDWEMATVGDPLMDLATSLAYWAEPDSPEALKAFSLTYLPGNLNREQVAGRYAQKTGANLKDLVFYYAFGCYKVAVIAQQIYARYRKGLTQDPRFAGLIYVVQACAENAQKAIEKGRISHLSK